MKNILFIAWGILAQVLVIFGQRAPKEFPVLKGPYLGQKSFGNVPEPFLPEIFLDNHSPAVFSPDGRKVFWKEISRNSLFFMEEMDGRWTAPQKVPFRSILYRMDAPFFTANSRLYFLSNRPFWGDGGIWYVELKNRRWSSWKSLGSPINDLCLHWGFSVVAKGTICFGGSGPSARGAFYIYRSGPVGAKYEALEKLDSVINAVDTDGGYAQATPLIAADESWIIFTSRRLDDAVGQGANLYISYRDAAGAWLIPVNLSRHWDMEGGEICPSLSPDGKFLLFLRWHEVYWVSSAFIKELRPAR